MPGATIAWTLYTFVTPPRERIPWRATPFDGVFRGVVYRQSGLRRTEKAVRREPVTDGGLDDLLLRVWPSALKPQFKSRPAECVGCGGRKPCGKRNQEWREVTGEGASENLRSWKRLWRDHLWPAAWAP